jgi:nucleic acid/nucleotide deaminase of polymorphic system toxin
MATSAAPATRQSESSWIERQRDQLPTYITSGFYRDEDGNSDLVQSGSESSGEDRAIARHLIERGLARPRGSATVPQHVETKVGWRMRQSGVQRAELIVNNRVCEGMLSCTEVLPEVLLPGQTLVVHDPVGSYAFHGRGTR